MIIEDIYYQTGYVKRGLKIKNMKVSKEELVKILTGEVKDPFYLERVGEFNRMKLHFSPTELLIRNILLTKYPSEPEDIRSYKIRNWKPITKTYVSKIYKALARIRQAEDYTINYPNKILKQYFDQYWSNKYGSTFEEWIFNNAFLAFLLDANGGVFFMPIEENESNEKILLEPIIISSEDIVYYKPLEFVIVKWNQPNSYIYIDRNSIYELQHLKQNSNNAKSNSIIIKEILVHNLDLFFFVQFGGNIKDINIPVYESVIAGITPFFESALLAFSELEAGIKQHVFPDKWRFATNKCVNCDGSGKITFKGNKEKPVTDKCPVCSGTGDMPTGMFAEVVIYPNTGLHEKAPIPPFGYVQKDFEPIEFLKGYYKQMLSEGLRAINMDYLADTPLNESGRAKEIDRSEFTSFLYEVSQLFIGKFVYNCIKILSRAYFYYTTEETFVNELQPTITVPRNFNFIYFEGSSILESMKKSGVGYDIIAEMERRYINKEFGNFPYEHAVLILCNTLDPLRGMTLDEKIETYNAGGVGYKDFILSINIRNIIKRIIERTYGLSFLNKPLLEQIQIINSELNNFIKEIEDYETDNKAMSSSAQSQVTDDEFNY